MKDAHRFAENLEFHPLTAARWADLEELFGKRGACGGCWCMWWRLKRAEFEKNKGEGNRLAMKSLVEQGEVPGLLAYHEGSPVGWCSVGPHEHFPVLDRSPVLKRVDDNPVWSVVCFFVAKPCRRRGVTEALLRAALDYAASRGAGIVEGYPVQPKTETAPDIFHYTGFPSTFHKLGFIEVARRSATRPIIRYFFK